MKTKNKEALVIEPTGLSGQISRCAGEAYFPQGEWYQSLSVDDSIDYSIPKGLLQGRQYLTADMLLDGSVMQVFFLILQEANDGPRFALRFSGLNQCSFRIRFPLDRVDQSQWSLDREGAWLKPKCRMSRVDLAKVDSMRLVVVRKEETPIRFTLTPFKALDHAPPRLEKLVLPQGKLLDEMGQSNICDWPGKTKSEAELKERLRAQLKGTEQASVDESLSRWGGCKAKKLVEGSGFFQTHFDGKRWWFADPEGYAFWSSGPDGVRSEVKCNYNQLDDALSFHPQDDPEFQDIYHFEIKDHLSSNSQHINYLGANFIRTFGSENWYENWGKITVSNLRKIKFNTFGNWSDIQLARKYSFPYVLPLSKRDFGVRNIFRDFPDVYDPLFAKEAERFARQLDEIKDDPACLGYFLMNEPTWGFAEELPLVGMLHSDMKCLTRAELVKFLRNRYHSSDNLQAKWGMDVTFERLENERIETPFTDQAQEDLTEFNAKIAKMYFDTLSAACKKRAPNHLNLGIRYQNVPPGWLVPAMSSFDVYSMNCYRSRVPEDTLDQIHGILKKPIIIGEWHFGALDSGLPSSGIGRVKDQFDRGRAYRYYLEHAAAHPACIGAHWFILYDQSPLGRGDGENYNIGFFDACHKPYVPLCDAAKTSHEHLYEIAEGKRPYYDDPPEYLPMIM